MYDPNEHDIADEVRAIKGRFTLVRALKHVRATYPRATRTAVEVCIHNLYHQGVLSYRPGGVYVMESPRFENVQH